MRRLPRQTVLAVLLAALSLAVPGVAANFDDLMQDFRVTPMGLKPAPAFGLKSVEGRAVTLVGHRGRPLLLYFWATW